MSLLTRWPRRYVVVLLSWLPTFVNQGLGVDFVALGQAAVIPHIALFVFLDVAGIIGAFVSGVILEVTGSWTLVFQVASGSTLFGLLFFLAFSSSRRLFD